MATYDLPYAEEHLTELFQEARTGEDVIIVRRDGRSCQLLPLANVKEEPLVSSKFKIPGFDHAGACIPT